MAVYEQLSKVAVVVTESLKASPGLLSLIVLQTVVFGLLYTNAEHRNTMQFEREMLILTQCLKK